MREDRRMEVHEGSQLDIEDAMGVLPPRQMEVHEGSQLDIEDAMGVLPPCKFIVSRKRQTQHSIAVSVRKSYPSDLSTIPTTLSI